MATKWDRVPKFDDDVVKSTMEDVRKVGKNTSNLRGAAVDAVKEAGSRAASRLAGRAGAAGAALQTGYDLGRDIDETTGIGKKMVDASGLGDLAAKAATSGDRVTLTKDAQERIEKGALNKKPVKRKVTRTTVSAQPASADDNEANNEYARMARDSDSGAEMPSGFKKGGMASASKRADGIARRGHTKWCSGGKVK